MDRKAIASDLVRIAKSIVGANYDGMSVGVTDVDALGIRFEVEYVIGDRLEIGGRAADVFSDKLDRLAREVSNILPTRNQFYKKPMAVESHGSKVQLVSVATLLWAPGTNPVPSFDEVEEKLGL